MANLFPTLGINPSAFALVGMAAVLAGTVHAPLTATILLFEMTNDYPIILPLMFCDTEVLQAITVSEAVQVGSATIPDAVTLVEAADILSQARHHGLPVVNAVGNLVGILTVQDIEHINAADRETTTVGAACMRELLVAYPDESINDALQRMSQRDVGRLPVVDRNFPRRLVGVLRRMDVIHAYDIALTRRTTQRHQSQRIRLNATTPEKVDAMDVVVELNAPCVGKKWGKFSGLMKRSSPQCGVVIRS